jgi:hypothetical protein
MKRKRNMQLGASIREYITNHPNATTEEVMAATGAKIKQQVYQQKTYMKMNSTPKRRAVEAHRPAAAISANGVPDPVNMEVSLPASGLRLKLKDGKKMVGTLAIGHHGIRFTPANGKKMPANQMPWRVLKALSGIEVG